MTSSEHEEDEIYEGPYSDNELVDLIPVSKILERQQMLINRIKKNLKHRRKWAKREGVSCYRLYDRDIPEIPMIIDLYEDRIHASVLPSSHLHPSQTVNVGQQWLYALCDAIQIDSQNSHLKVRERQKGKSQYMPGERVGERLCVNEAGLKFWVNLRDYIDTGLFLDHRLTRERVAEEAQGKRFLNLFAYTGSFTIYAASGGARETVTVDSTSTYLEWSKDNMALNGLEGDHHQFIRADVREYLDLIASAGHRFDLVVLDPPTFSNSKGEQSPFDVRRHHPHLFERLHRVMPQGGILYFSNNARRFTLHQDLMRKWLIEEITAQTTPLDFSQRRAHRCWRCIKR